jgi:lysophospholipase L1-like esterase
LRIWRLIKAALLLLLLGVIIVLAVLMYQGKQTPRINAPYVALGSSFAAGLGLGARKAGSPFICQRTLNGYPQQLARMAELSLTDMSCSGATVGHVLRGRQVFLGPQIDAVGPATRLVTLTAGGNDIAYIGDLTAMAYQRQGGIPGFLVGQFWKGAKPADNRDFAALRSDLVSTLRKIRGRAPKAQIIVVTYPAILPETGTCNQLGIDAAQADLMRPVALRLADVTRSAAKEAGATVVEMATLSKDHDACTTQPWTNGWAPTEGVAFHPTLVGTKAIAAQIMTKLNEDIRQ